MHKLADLTLTGIAGPTMVWLKVDLDTFEVTNK